MYYRLPWFYISLLTTLLTILAYLYDISPLNSQITKLTLKEKSLKEKIYNLKSSPPIMIEEKLPTQNKSDKNFEFISLIRTSGLRIKKIKIISSQENEKFETRFTLQLLGEFQQLSALILILKTYKYLTMINDFSYTVEKNYLIINMDITIYNQVRQEFNQIKQVENNKINKKSDNLFCLPHLIIH